MTSFIALVEVCVQYSFRAKFVKFEKVGLSNTS